MAVTQDRIIRHLTLSAPPGELQEVVTDLATLLGTPVSQVSGHIEEYNMEQFAIAQTTDGKKFIVSKYGQRDGAFYDLRLGAAYTVDHLSLSASPSGASVSVPGEVADKFSPLEEALVKYVEDHYVDGVFSIYSSPSPNELIICFTACKFFPNKYWSGRWRSVYRVTYDGDKAKVSGTMKMSVHYFEDGNVQLNASHEHGETASGPNLAVAVAAVIKKAEQNFQNQLDATVASMNDSTFKALRRRLPITGTPVDFESTAHKMVGELRRK